MSVIKDAIEKYIQQWKNDGLLRPDSKPCDFGAYDLGKYIALDIWLGTKGLTNDEKIRMFQAIETEIADQKYRLKSWRKEEKNVL